MKVLAELTQRVAAIETAQDNMMQVGQVIGVSEDGAKVDIDVKGIKLLGIPYYTQRAGTNGKTYWVPEIGEFGMLHSPGGDVGNAIFLTGINFQDSLPPETDTNVTVRQFKDGIEERYDGNDDTIVLSVGEEVERKASKEGEIKDSAGKAQITIDKTPSAKLETAVNTFIELLSTKVKAQVSPTVYIELAAALANVAGCHFFPTGLTTIVTPVGNGFFAPAPSPASPPPAPSGSSPNDKGEATKVPASETTGVGMKSGRIRFTIPSRPIIGGVAGTVPVVANTPPIVCDITFNASGVTLVFPSRDL